MRTALLGGLMTAGLFLAMARGQNREASVYSSVTSHGNNPALELVTHFAQSNNGPHALVVVDPKQKVLGVYHVNATTGSISLKSVRQIRWDLEMIQFNSENPSPQEIRSGLQP